MKRYDMEDVGPAYHQHTEMIEREDGLWVDYDDVEALTQLNKELIEALELTLVSACNPDECSEDFCDSMLEILLKSKELAE